MAKIGPQVTEMALQVADRVAARVAERVGAAVAKSVQAEVELRFAKIQSHLQTA